MEIATAKKNSTTKPPAQTNQDKLNPSPTIQIKSEAKKTHTGGLARVKLSHGLSIRTIGAFLQLPYGTMSIKKATLYAF